jgi:hypothetical protein
MAEYWDQFPMNITETAGRIERKSFIFHYIRFEVWQNGSCIYSGASNGKIVANMKNEQLNVNIDDNRINNYIIKQFSFAEISTNGDRIMWSKDIFNSNGRSEHNNPDISSLFFKQGILNKVTFTIHDPNTLVEFYSDNSEEANKSYNKLQQVFQELLQTQSNKESEEEYFDEVEIGDNQDLELNFVFHSSDHIRYESGCHVSGPHGGAPRAIKVEDNISGNEGYTVTLFNTDGGQAVVQMAPKQMKLFGIDKQKIQLKGYGRDVIGASFADYGLTIYHDNGNIEKCILHMFDRSVDIEYLL